MYKFIDEIKDKKERIEQILLQTSEGFDGYFNKCMIQDLHLYQEIPRKSCFKIITPQQSVMAYAKESHERVCNAVLETMYKINFQGKDYKTKNNDLENNIKLGNIYIKIHDTNTSLKEDSKKEDIPQETSFVYIFIPEFFNKYQFEELKKSILTIKKYDERYIKQAYAIIHYIDFEIDDRNCYVDDKIYDFLGDYKNPGIAQKYIKDVPILSEENILIGSLSKEEER